MFECTCFYIHIINISAVKRLKYLIAINHIYVIVNSKLIAINRKFLSILNVPSFIYFSIFLFLFECPYQHGKVDWLALCKCFILLKTNIAKQGGTKLNYKVHISGKQGPYSAVKPWLNIFFFSSLLGT